MVKIQNHIHICKTQISIKRTVSLLSFVFTIAVKVLAQDIQYSQFYAAPLYLNPALAGTSEQHRMNLNFRDQWPSIPGNYISYSISYDINLLDANSGIGFIASRDQAGTGGLSTTTIGGSYAYNIKLNRKMSFRPAIGLNYGLRTVDVSKLTFGDQLLTGSASSVQSSSLNDRVSYVDVNAGGLLYGKDFWVGYSVYHINQPNNSLLGQENLIDARHSVHAGYRLPMQKTVKRKVVRSMTIAANYKTQGKWDQFDIGAYYYFKPMVIGIWYRGIPGLKKYAPGYQNNDAVTLLVGVHFKNVKFAYSYDITVSKLYPNTGGSHELSFIYEYTNPNKGRKRRFSQLACPQF
ncbi:MAG: type IX secretion system PorP/SprF family membrane protein [Salibacteraceae bacterium]|jgi:type IX secretion system PorP/SprF family membrane protein